MTRKRPHSILVLLSVCIPLFGPTPLSTIGEGKVAVKAGENGYDLWLRYRTVDDSALLERYRRGIREIVMEGRSDAFDAARDELRIGLSGLLGVQVPRSAAVYQDGALLIGTPKTSPAIERLGWKKQLDALGPEGFRIRSIRADGKQAIASSGDAGVLYGVFHFLRLLQTRRPLEELDISEKPGIQRRLLNHWDSILKYDDPGSFDRVYAGETLWKWDVLPDVPDSRYRDYARACASIGINGTVINNVDAEPFILRTDYIRKWKALADVFRAYGIRVYVSVNFASPMKPSITPAARKHWGGIGNLDTADPLDPRVRNWWKNQTAQIYKAVPDFGGFLVKANSEGMPGPNDYGRTHADGANLFAEILEPYGGVVMWRAFVYPEKADPDRAKRAYMEFVPLDGRFRKNVFVQLKNGPLDFQPREPFHPLFGAMPKTPLMAEFQITQEYLGHSTHLVYLAPLWKKILDSDTYARGKGSTVARIVDGSLHGLHMSGIAGVANVGSDSNRCGHPFAQANWYAFGRLAWDSGLRSEQIADEWIRMTWGSDSEVLGTVRDMMSGSHEACVNSMTPLGLNYTVEAGAHYDPNPKIRQGTYWISDSKGIGYDRTERGSNAVWQYFPPVRELFGNIVSCPEQFLLWFHFVPWDHRMQSGRTLWDELCFRYNDGVRYVDGMLRQWQTLQDKIDLRRFEQVKERLIRQKDHAILWRKACIGYFHESSEKPVATFPETRK